MILQKFAVHELDQYQWEASVYVSHAKVECTRTSRYKFTIARGFNTLHLEVIVYFLVLDFFLRTEEVNGIEDCWKV